MIASRRVKDITHDDVRIGPRPKPSTNPVERLQPNLQLLSQSGLLLHEERPGLISATALILSALVIAFIVWAAVTQVSEVARAPGEIVPVGYMQSVQHADGGIVKEIFVHEQQLVEAGQVLLRLSGIGVEREHEEADAMLSALTRRRATLQAFRQHDPAAQAAGDPMALAALRAARTSERAVLAQQLSQKTDEIAALDAELASYQKQAAVNQAEFDNLSNLRAKGLVTITRLHDAELRTVEANGARDRTLAQLSAAHKAVTEYHGRLIALDAKYEDQTAQEISELDGKIAQATSRVSRLQEQIARLTVTAPIRGYIKGLQINTIGAVIAPGQVLFEIVPAVDSAADPARALAADIHVAATDIGFVAVGQPVRLKVSAFDFARFGVFTGHITALSAAAFTEASPLAGTQPTTQTGPKYYKARVTLDDSAAPQQHDGESQNRRVGELRPGMTLEGDIVLGHQSVLDYLLKPIHAVTATALTER